MKVLFDSNIVIEAYDEERAFVNEAKQLMREVSNRRLKGYLTAASFYTICFYGERCLKKIGLPKEERIVKLRAYLSTILNNFTIVEQDNKELAKGVQNLEFYDIEDACQYQAALKSKCDYLVTIDTKDFKDCTGKTIIMHPVDFIKLIG